MVGGDLLDLAVGDVEGVEDLGLGDAFSAGFDHQDGLVGAGHDQVEVEQRVVFLGRVDDEVAVQHADADRTDGGGNRNRRDRQGCGSTVHGHDVVGVDLVHRHRDGHELSLVVPALGEERADRTVDHAGSQGGLFAGACFTAEEGARNLADGVHALFDVDGQGQEVNVAKTSDGGGGENLGVARLDDDGAAGLLGQLAGFERNLVLADTHGSARSFKNAH